MKKRFVPQAATIQYAGNIGMFAAGPSWSYGKKRNWETDVLLGFFPKENGISGAATFTLRENLVPWRFEFSEISKNKHLSPITFSPAVFSLEGNFISGSQYWFHKPKKYDNSRYYRFSLRARATLGFGSRVGIGRTEFYYNLSAYDFAIRYAICNKSIDVFDILALGLGVRYQFF